MGQMDPSKTLQKRTNDGYMFSMDKPQCVCVALPMKYSKVTKSKIIREKPDLVFKCLNI